MKQENSSKSVLKLSKSLEKERELKKKAKKLKKTKDRAKQRQKAASRKKIEKKKVVLESLLDDDMKLEQDSSNVAEKVIQNIKLFEWVAPIRMNVIFSKKTFLSVIFLVLIFELYLVILGHNALAFVMLALLFLIYVLGVNKPEEVKHKVTARGIDTLDRLFEWAELKDFWFSEKNEQHLLIVRTEILSIPQLIMLIEVKDRAAIFTLLEDKLLYRDIRKEQWLDKLTFGKYISLEDI